MAQNNVIVKQQVTDDGITPALTSCVMKKEDGGEWEWEKRRQTAMSPSTASEPTQDVIVVVVVSQFAHAG